MDMPDDSQNELFNAAPVPLVLTSFDGVILGVNRRFTLETGYTLRDIPTVDKWWKAAYPDPSYRDWVKGLWASTVGPALSLGRTIEGGEFTVCCKDGTRRIYIMNVQPLKEHILVDLVDITEQKETARRLAERKEIIRRQGDLAKAVMISESLLDGNVEVFLREITESGVNGLGVARSSVWLYDDQYEIISCIEAFDADSSRHSSGDTLRCSSFPEYTSAHRRGAVIAATDVRVDPRTLNLDAEYLNTHAIQSLLDVPLYFNGRMSGLLSFETTGHTREWNSDDERFALILASATSLCFEISERKTAEKTIQALNATLESKVTAQTADLFHANETLQRVNTHLKENIQRLKETQSVMVMNEKLVSLGRLVAGLSHELNTPLAVINESLSFITEHVAGHSAAKTQEQAQYLDDGERDIIRRIRHSLSEQFEEDPSLPLPNQNRLNRKAVLQHFREKQLPHADEVVDELSDLGLLSCASQLEPALSGPHQKPFREVLGSVIGIARSAQLARHAVGKVSDVFAALRAYVTVDSADVPESFALKEAIDALVVLRPDIAARGIVLYRDIPEGLHVYGKRAEIGRICYNILSNAILAVPAGGRIDIVAWPEGPKVRISIRDSGPGIPPELAERIFEPFFTTRAPGEGAGVGLDIARRLADANGATIDFTSEPGNTIFNVHLPVSAGT